jgi:hypothetical protein
MILSRVTGRAIATKIKAHGEVLITDDYPGMDSREINSDFQPSRSSKKLGVIDFHPHNNKLNTVQVVFNGTPITAGQLRFIHKHAPGQKPDEILCHEMLHASRYLGGDFNMAPDNLRLIAKFSKQHPVIAPMIASAPAAFNPIRYYYVLVNSS